MVQKDGPGRWGGRCAAPKPGAKAPPCPGDNHSTHSGTSSAPACHLKHATITVNGTAEG